MDTSVALVPVEPLIWPALPTETEIYILPDGRVVVADMPIELASLLAELGPVEPCAVVEAVASPEIATVTDSLINPERAVHGDH